MSKNVAVFVDVANIYYSARGQEVDVDYVALLKAATKGRDLIRAYAYSGLDPENENQRKFIDFLGKNGYKVVHKDIRKFGDGRMKANLDIELVVDLFRLANRMDIAVIVSGDGDFAPAIRALQDGGVRCEVYSFRPNTSSDLLAVADEFVDMMKIIGIGRGKDADKADKVMGAPPMPAKEVVPEFGFREAPAAVAAAALAALREGKAAPATRRRGRTATAAAAPADAVVADAPAAAEAGPAIEGTAEAGADGRRRRRRRGGRGRGRGRGREEGAVSAADAPAGETAWVDADDASEIGELSEPREYTFEEADSATLAELGLLIESAPIAASSDLNDDAAAGIAPKPPRGRTPKAASPAAADALAKAGAPSGRARPARSPKAATERMAEPAKATRSTPRSRRPKVTPAEAPAAAEAGSAAKPRRASRAASKTAAPASPTSAESTASGEGDAEGIWQRFRTARTPKS